MSNFKKAILQEGRNILSRIQEQAQSARARAHRTGVAQDKLVEPVPKFNQAPSEKVIAGENNTSIVLGRDRPGGIMTGYGAKGDTQAGSIDIVVGRGGAEPREVDENGERVVVNPNFEKDAARIHLSHKTDVDENFRLPRGSGNSVSKSAIGMKADNVRVMARERVKVVAGLDSENSQGGSSTANYGIDLISTANEELQPIPLGKNLAQAISELRDEVDELNGVIESVVRTLTTVLPVIAAHTHASPGSPSVGLLASVPAAAISLGGQTYYSIIANKLNAARYKFLYLTPAGASYINSRYNKTS